MVKTIKPIKYSPNSIFTAGKKVKTKKFPGQN